MQFERITIDPSCMKGQPCIRDRGLTVKRVVEIVAATPDRETIKREYQLDDQDIAQALTYAASMVDRAVCWLR